jgi:16S rRNA processing protein RimM
VVTVPEEAAKAVPAGQAEEIRPVEGAEKAEEAGQSRQTAPAGELPEAGLAGQPAQAGHPEAWVWLARIRRPQGRKGEVFADILTDFPEKFAERKRLWLLREPSAVKPGPAKPTPAKGAGANSNPKRMKSTAASAPTAASASRATPFPAAALASQGASPADSSASAAPREAELIAHWLHKGGVVLHFAGVDSISAAEALAGLIVAIPYTERAALGEDEVYIGDLIGCLLVDVAQENASGPAPVVVGEIEAVDRTAGPVALLVVRGVAGEILIPFAKSYLRKIDLAARRVEMALPEGLVDLNA